MQKYVSSSFPGYVGDAPVCERDDDLECCGLDAGQGDVDVVLEREVGEVRAEDLREQLGDGRDHTPEDGWCKVSIISHWRLS